MDDQYVRLEAEIRGLTQNIRELERRVAWLEEHKLAAKPQAEATDGIAAPASQAVPAAAGWRDTSALLPLTGRLFIVLGGAYFLRALTEASTLTPILGVSLGLVYSLIWCYCSDMAAARGRLWSSAFHGAAAALIAYPLVWEAVTRFRILPSPMDAGLLAFLTAVILSVAGRRRLQMLAWFAVIGALASTVALAFATEIFIPHSVTLIALGIATLWIGYELDWFGLRWPVAFVADLSVLAITLRALAAERRESVAAALTVQLLLLGLYLSSIAIRTLVRGRNVIPFEIVQMIAAFLLGFVGAVYTTQDTGFGIMILGAAGLILGASCYFVAYAFVNKKVGRGINFYFYTSLALLFSLTGSALLLRGTLLSLAWISLGVLMAWLGWRHSRLALTLHATLCILASAVATGLIAYAATGLVGPAALVGTAPTAAQFLVLCGAAFFVGLPMDSDSEGGPRWLRTQRLLITIVLVAGTGGVLDSVLARLMAGIPGGGVNAGILATVRTVVLALAALLLAWLGRSRRFLEWGWLVYPLLGLTGVKILFEDMRHSRPATLFLALAIYGCALIGSPRLRRTGKGATAIPNGG